MAGSIFVGVLAVFGAIALVWAVLKVLAMSGLTASLVFNLGFAPPPPQPVPPPPPAVVAPAPAPAPQAPAVSSDTKLIMDALERMDLRQQARDGKQDERIGRLEQRIGDRWDKPVRISAGPCDECGPEGRWDDEHPIVVRARPR